MLARRAIGRVEQMSQAQKGEQPGFDVATVILNADAAKVYHYPARNRFARDRSSRWEPESKEVPIMDTPFRNCRARPPLVGAGERRCGAVPRRGRCVHRQRRDPIHPRRPARRRGRDPGGRRGLPDRLRRAGDHRRPARRHRRPQARVHRRRTRLHAGVALVRTVRIGCDADLRPCRAGRRRGDDGAASACVDPHAVPRRRARPCLHHLRRCDRPGCRCRLHARWLAGDAEPCRPRLAQHLLRQRADRGRHCARRRMADAGDAAQRRHAARPARRRRAVRRPCSA